MCDQIFGNYKPINIHNLGINYENHSKKVLSVIYHNLVALIIPQCCIKLVLLLLYKKKLKLSSNSFLIS